MANPNPTNKFQKGHKPVGRKPGLPNLMTRDIKTLIREAAEEAGFIQRVPVLDEAGKPTGRREFKYGTDGEKAYLKWLAINHPGPFVSLYRRLLPYEVNAKVINPRIGPGRQISSEINRMGREPDLPRRRCS